MANEKLLSLLAIVYVAIPTLGLSYSAPAAVSHPLWRTYTSSSYYYYPKPQTPSKPRYTPPPQFCPDTGGTLCTDVDAYPSDQMFKVLSDTKSRRFNFSSVFFDERNGDQEPNLSAIPIAPPKSIHSPQDGYIVYQTSVHYDYQHGPTNAPTNWGYVAPAPIVPTYSRTPFSSTGFPVQQQQHRFRKRQAPDDGLFENEDVLEACQTKVDYIAPKAALGDDSTWKFIVNLRDKDPTFKQVVKVDICRNANRPCAQQVSLPLGYVSRCTQKYAKKCMLALAKNGQETEKMMVFVPSCCVCEIISPKSSKK